MFRSNLTFVGRCIVIYLYSKTNKMHQCIKLFYFGTTLYMFRTVFPSIAKSSRLYIQQPNRYCCLLASGYASKQIAVFVWHSSICLTQQYLSDTAVSVWHSSICLTAVSVWHSSICLTAVSVWHSSICLTQQYLFDTAVSVWHSSICLTQQYLSDTAVSVWQQYLSDTAVSVWHSSICLTAVSVWQMPVAVCTVLNSWWWTERPSETCRVSFQNKINLIHWCI